MRNIQQLLTLTLLVLPFSALLAAQEIELADFLSNHMSEEKVVSIDTEPATTYSHLHYQLLDGQNFLIAESLPARFTNITLKCYPA